MKRVLLSLFCASSMLLAFPKDSDGDALQFRTQSHDFGTIKSTNGAVSCEYKFVNVGKAPVAILMVTNGGCGCTTPMYPHKPIAPGDSGVVKITFDPAHRQGEFSREVKVRYTSEKKTHMLKLRFSGVILPEQNN